MSLLLLFRPRATEAGGGGGSDTNTVYVGLVDGVGVRELLDGVDRFRILEDGTEYRELSDGRGTVTISPDYVIRLVN